jgi:hypothetical protein
MPPFEIAVEAMATFLASLSFSSSISPSSSSLLTPLLDEVGLKSFASALSRERGVLAAVNPFFPAAGPSPGRKFCGMTHFARILWRSPSRLAADSFRSSLSSSLDNFCT